MTEKRFTYDSKTVSILQDGKFWLDGNVDTACNHSEICNELNKLVDENEQLKQFKNKTFDLLDKEITKNEEAIEVFEKQGSDVGAMGFYTNMLKILRKELKE